MLLKKYLSSGKHNVVKVMVVLELRDWFAQPVKHFTTEGARSLVHLCFSALI